MFLVFITAVLLPLLAISWISSFLYTNINSDFHAPAPWHWIFSFITPVLLAAYGLKKGSLNQSGAVAGLFIGFLLSISCLRFCMCLLAFFIFASRATKFRSSRKKKFEADFKEGGQRNWIQVVSNGGPAAIIAVFYMFEAGSVDLPVDFNKLFSASWYAIAVMSALASACGDTFASEIGTVFGNRDPVHILSWKQVPRGTNGGVSLVGTLSSVLGGLIVGTAFYVTALLIFNWATLQESSPQWPVIIYGGLAGFLGSMIDSFLGASLQYSGKHKRLGCIVECKSSDVEYICGREILDNHSVNLLSSLITGLIIPFIAARTWRAFI